MAKRATPKLLIIIRHAHRNKPHGRQADDGLSEKGQAQMQAMTKFFLNHVQEAKPVFLSSPKRRCMETVERLAASLGTTVVGTRELMEHGDYASKESDAQFKRRVKAFCETQLTNKDKVIVLCSHGDWIPEALHSLTRIPLSLKKCGYAEFEVTSGDPHLTWLVQTFPK